MSVQAGYYFFLNSFHIQSVIADKNSNPVFEYRHAVLSQVPVFDCKWSI